MLAQPSHITLENKVDSVEHLQCSFGCRISVRRHAAVRRPGKHFRTVPFGRCPADASPSSNQRSSEFLCPVLPKARSSPVVEARVVLLPSPALGYCVESRGLGSEAAGDLKAERHEDPAVGEILVLPKTLTPASIGSFPFLLRRC